MLVYLEILPFKFVEVDLITSLRILIGKPFSKPVSLKEETHELLKTWCENLDLCGNNITSFAREVFSKGLNKGLVHILIDYPKNNKEKFISLMLIFGQIKLLQILMRRFDINNKEIEHLEDNYFN